MSIPASPRHWCNLGLLSYRHNLTKGKTGSRLSVLLINFINSKIFAEHPSCTLGSVVGAGDRQGLCRGKRQTDEQEKIRS